MGSAAAESNERSGHTEALYREHGAAVAGLCRSLLRDRAEAEDATQQVFLSAHRALLNGAVPREPLAWLLAVARNECYARFRQRAAVPLPAGEAQDRATTADASVHVVRAGELASVWDEVGRMPAAQREAFLLREVRGLSYRQVGAELSLSPPSVRSLLLRARRRLRHRLGDVAAGLGGAPWVQAILRLAAGGGDAASPVPAATKAAAVGLGAVALAGGAALPRVVHHPATTPPPATVHHRAAAHPRHFAAPVVVPVVRAEHPSEVTNDRSAQATGRQSRRSGRSRSREGSNSLGTENSGSSSQSGGSDDGSEAVAAAPVVQPKTSGHDGGGDSSSGPGSDGGSGSVTTVASSGSSGPASSGSDDSGGGDSHGSGSDGGSDG